MKRRVFTLIIVLAITSGALAGGGKQMATMPEIALNQGSVGLFELWLEGPANGSNIGSVIQSQDAVADGVLAWQDEIAKICQFSDLWGEGANSAEVASEQMSQSLTADKDSSTIQQGIDAGTKTQIWTTAPTKGWCWWEPGSGGSVSNVLDICQTETAVTPKTYATQTESVKISTNITASGGGSGVAVNNVSAGQSNEVSNTPVPGWGGCW